MCLDYKADTAPALVAQLVRDRGQVHPIRARVFEGMRGFEGWAGPLKRAALVRM
jgi:hypothetical protein